MTIRLLLRKRFRMWQAQKMLQVGTQVLQVWWLRVLVDSQIRWTR